MTAQASSSAAWTWLLGTTAAGSRGATAAPAFPPGGAFRHAPFRASDPGQGQDPALEPRVEVIRRLIAYPGAAFETLVAAARAADRDARQPIRWVCHRAAGEAPARPYWVSFLRARPGGGRRFVVGLELFDRGQLGLWFFSGYVDAAIPPEAKAPFPDRPEVSLPRFVVTDEGVRARPFELWIGLAFEDALSFQQHADVTQLTLGASAGPTSGPPSAGASPTLGRRATTDASAPIESTLPPVYAGAAGALEDVELRAARARLVVCPPGAAPRILPLARLSTTFGRDPRVDVLLDDRTVSFEHVRIAWREGTPVVEDLGSKNGTRVEARVARKGERVPIPDEALIAIGRVPCLFVRDAEETLPPGAQPAPRHEARLTELLASGRLKAEDAERARTEARARGITPGEVLVLGGKLSPEAWRGRPPVASSGQGCLVLLAAGIAALGAATAAFLAAVPGAR